MRMNHPKCFKYRSSAMAGLIRMDVIVNNYRTNSDDFIELYLFGIQVYRWNY